MKITKKGLLTALSGFSVGAVNGLFGAGGGMIAVPLLNSKGLDRKKSHANAVAVILPLSIISAGLYLFKGNVSLSDALPYIPTGAVGAVAGTLILKKISPLWLKRIFGGFMVYAGIRMILR